MALHNRVHSWKPMEPQRTNVKCNVQKRRTNVMKKIRYSCNLKTQPKNIYYPQGLSRMQECSTAWIIWFSLINFPENNCLPSLTIRPINLLKHEWSGFWQCNYVQRRCFKNSFVIRRKLQNKLTEVNFQMYHIAPYIQTCWERTQVKNAVKPTILHNHGTSARLIWCKM